MQNRCIVMWQKMIISRIQIPHHGRGSEKLLTRKKRLLALVGQEHRVADEVILQKYSFYAEGKCDCPRSND